MANIKINQTPSRVQYQATAGQTVFSYTFPIKASGDLKVYKRGATDTPDDDADLLTITTDYTVTGANTASGGTVTLVVAASLNDVITIVGDKPIDRTAIYDNSTTVSKADLNNDFNDNVMYDKQIETIQNELVLKYNRSELIGPGVREDNVRLPILNDGEVWIGRGDNGDSPDDVTTLDISTAAPLFSATYIIQTAESLLPNAQVLASLTTGLVKNTAVTGVLSIAVEGTDYYAPGGTDVAIGDGGTGASTAAGARTNLDVQQDLSGLVLTAVAVQGVDKVLIQDDSDSDNLKTVTAQSIADLFDSSGLANVALSNLSGVAINTSLISDTDITDDLGSAAVRWNNTYTATVRTGDTAADTLLLQAYDVDGMSWTTFATLTANNTPTMALSGDVTSVTQGASDNSTKIATTAYVDNAVLGGGAPTNASYITQVAEAGLSNEQALSLLATGIMKNTTTTGVITIAVEGTDYYGPAGTDIPVTDGGTGASDAATARTNLGVAIGTDVQAYDATLQSLSALGTAADRYAYTTGVDTWAEGTITAAGRNFLDDANAADQRATIDAQQDLDGLALAAVAVATGDKVLIQDITDTDTLKTVTAQSIADLYDASGKANVALDNLAGVAINTSLISDTDITDDLGSVSLRWNNIYTATVRTGDTANDTLLLQAYDVDGVSWKTFATLTANNTPTMALDGDVTGVTQSPGDNSTKLATTAYVDAAAGDAPVDATYITQTPNGTLTNEQALSLLATGIMKSTTTTGVISIAVEGTDYYGPGGTDIPITDGGTGASDAGTARTNLGLAIGTDVQAYDATLQSLSSLGTAADRYAYTTGIDTWAEGVITAAGRAILDDASASAQRTTLDAQQDLSGLSLTAVAVQGTDKVLVQDTSDTDNLKTVTAQSIADLYDASAKANVALDNLSGVAINTSLISDTDITDDLGSAAIRWRDIYTSSLRTGDTNTDTLTIDARDVDGASWTTFITLTAGNTPTCALASAVTGVTQSANDNSTKLATTAYVDTEVALHATTELDNLGTVAINTSLISDTDVTDDLGSSSIRWANVYSSTLRTGDTATDTLVVSARDVDGASWTDFITLTAGNTPTCAFSGDITSVTQTPGDNSTKLATTAYVDAAGGAPATATYITQTPDGTLSAEQALSLLSTGIMKSTTGTGVVSIAVEGTDYYGPGGTDVAVGDGGTGASDAATARTNLDAQQDLSGLSLTAVAVQGTDKVLIQDTSDTDNLKTVTAQSIADLFDASGKANVALDNLSAVAINTSLISDTDITDDLGSAAIRWRDYYGQTLRTGDTATDTLTLQARDVDGASWTTFVTLTAANTPTCVLASAVTGTTQSAGDNSTKLATTAYVDTESALKATIELDNLGTVAINTSLVSDTDVTDDLGTAAIRWNNVYSSTLRTGDTAADTLTLDARDVDGVSWTTFVTLTAGNTPTCVFSGDITGVTQSASDNSTKLATTAYVDNAVSGGGANTALSNLAAVAINTSLISDTDITDDLGSAAIRWRDAYTSTLRTGDTAADTLLLQARDVDGGAWTTFATLTANNTPTMSLDGAVTGTTQSANDNSTKLATTAYVDTESATKQDDLSGLSLTAVTVATNDKVLIQDTGDADNLKTVTAQSVADLFDASGKADTNLGNLASVAINTSLISDTDITDDLGTAAIRWRDIYSSTLRTGDTAADTLVIGARDVDGASWTPFITLTANNTPTCVLASGVTGTTQSANDNSTKLATTAYVDTEAALHATTELDNLGTVAINTSLISDTDVTDDLGSAAIRWNNVYGATLRTGDTAADTLTLDARDVDGASWITFVTLTANNTPTCALSGDVTGVTQSPSDNSTKLATTAYADAAAAGGGATTALNNLAAVAINTSLVSDTDVTDDLGSAAIRWNNTYSATLRTGDTAADTLLLQARDVDGASWTTFATLTANNTPTMSLSGDVTSVTQSAGDNSTKIATTAYVDDAANDVARTAWITIDDPDTNVDATLFKCDAALTISEIVVVLRGTSSPDVTWTLKHGTDRSAAGTTIDSNTSSSTTTGNSYTVLDDATVPTDSYIWLEVSATTGTVNEMNLTFYFTFD